MHRSTRRLATTLVVLTVLSLFPTVAHAQSQALRRAADVGSGQPVEAALAVSQEVFADDSAPAVVLGRSDDFADNLGGAVLARTLGAPLLLNPSDSLDERVRAEMDRVLPPGDCAELVGRGEFEVYMLGGTNALSQEIEDELFGEYCYKRVSGPTRVETSLQVAEEVLHIRENRGETGEPELLIARSDNAVDSATGGAYGGMFGAPVLVTPSHTLHPDIGRFINLGVSSVTLLGGEAALSAEVEAMVNEALSDQEIVATRLAGASRDDTARVIAEDFAARSSGIDAVTLVNGYVDDAWVLAFTSAAANTGEPVLYVAADDLLETTRSFIGAQAPLSTVSAFGDSSLVSDAVLQEAAGAAG